MIVDDIVIYGNGMYECSLLFFDAQTEKSEMIVKDCKLNNCILDEQYLFIWMEHLLLNYDIELSNISYLL